jgi:hypothetical protein
LDGLVQLVRTNSDLYLAMSRLGGAAHRPLEEFLRAWWSTGYDRSGTKALEPAELVGWVEEALESFAPPFERYWTRENLGADDLDGFEAWSRVIRSQICDLRELESAGAMRDQNRYLGLDAPRPPGAGARSNPTRWLNFDTASYLEAGVMGTVGGWRPEFDGAVVDEAPAEPQAIGAFDWNDLNRFVLAAQTSQ